MLALLHVSINQHCKMSEELLEVSEYRLANYNEYKMLVTVYRWSTEASIEPLRLVEKNAGYHPEPGPYQEEARPIRFNIWETEDGRLFTEYTCGNIGIEKEDARESDEYKQYHSQS